MGGPLPDDYTDWDHLAEYVLRSAFYDLVCAGGAYYSLLEDHFGLSVKGDLKSWANRVISHRAGINLQLKAIIRWLIRGHPLPKSLKKYFSFSWNPQGAKALRWARWAIRKPLNHERAFWVQVRDGLREELKVLTAIDLSVRRRHPLSEDQHRKLIEYTILGELRPLRLIGESGDESVEVVLEPSWEDINADEVYQRVHAALVPIAYQLSLEWATSQPWPRYVITCRNPYCGRRFYSGHVKARTCPRVPRSGRRSGCKAIWEAYQKWLGKAGHAPEATWHRAELQASFKSQFKARGNQARS
jgi:hypothetical protein